MLRNFKINIDTALVFIVLFCTYIFPLGLIDNTYIYSKMIFVACSMIYLVLNIKSFTFKNLIFIILLLLLSIFLKDISYMFFITLPILDKLMKKEEIIKDYILNSNILFVCLLFTIIYTIVFWGNEGRYAFSAIKEVNQSGLAIFCLGCLLLKKNRNIGIITLSFGLLTFSRSYILALFLLILTKTKIYKKIVSNALIKRSSYTFLVFISSIIFIFIGLYFIQQYKLGNVIYSNIISKRLNLLDYSNFYRFIAILKVIFIYKNEPFKLFTGVTSDEYILYSIEFSKANSIPNRNIVPHNLFFSHIKIYGIIAIAETIYVSTILKKIVNKDNYGIYIAIVLYSLLLGAGLYSYWLFLSVFVLIIFSNNWGDSYEK